MKLNTQKNTKIIKVDVDSSAFLKAANDDNYCLDADSLKLELSNGNNDVIHIAQNLHLKSVIKLAFDHRTILYLDNNAKYDFSCVKTVKSGIKSQYIPLLELATESVLLNHAIEIVSHELKEQIPFRLSYKKAKKILKKAINSKLYAELALATFEEIYKEHVTQVNKFIAPEAHPKVKTIQLSYKNELMDFLVNNDGVFVLKSPMGSGKSTHGITEPFHFWCDIESFKPIVITPDIALSKQILGEDDSRHYLNKNLRKSLENTLPELKGLVCCVNSATTNDSFYEYSVNTGTVMIEEFEECALALTQPLIGDGRLSERAKANDRFFSLLHKDKVIIADALFSDLSALVLDSFLGSGTTSAVAAKMGRKFIGIELGEHAENLCAYRQQKVIDGEQGGISKDVNWQGGRGFKFYRLGEVIFNENGSLKEGISFNALAAHIWYGDTRNSLEQKEKSPLLGVHNGIAYYLLYNGILGDKRPDGGNVLTSKVLALLPEHPLDPEGGKKVIYGETSRMGAARLKSENIIFKQIPYDVRGR